MGLNPPEEWRKWRGKDLCRKCTPVFNAKRPRNLSPEELKKSLYTFKHEIRG
jgi:hypothetical protein